MNSDLKFGDFSKIKKNMYSFKTSRVTYQNTRIEKLNMPMNFYVARLVSKILILILNIFLMLHFIFTSSVNFNIFENWIDI